MPLREEVRVGIRMLMRQPGFAAIAIATLALGMGANTAIYAVVQSVLLRPLPYPDADRLVQVWTSTPKSLRNHVSAPDFADFVSGSRSFSSLASFSGRWGGPETVTGGREPERAWTTRVSREFFATLRVRPALGPGLSARDHRPGADPAAVVSRDLWRRSLGSRRDLEGVHLMIGGRSYRVAGVMPAGFRFPDPTDVWIPDELVPTSPFRSAHNSRVIGRLAPGVSLEAARSEMMAIGERLARSYPDTNRQEGVSVMPLRDEVVGSLRPALLILASAVGLLLLIACANVASLSLARASGRRKELAIRSALGATSFQIARQLLIESLLLAFAGGAAAIGLAAALIRALVAFGPGNLPRGDEIAMDWRAMAFTAAVCVGASVLFGLGPALRSARPDLAPALTEGGRNSGGSRERERLRSGIVLLQLGFTTVLLVGAALLLGSFWSLLRVPPGFVADGVLAVEASLPASPGGVVARRFYAAALQRVRSLPGVEAAGAISLLPVAAPNVNGSVLLDGVPDPVRASYRVVSPGYFEALRIPLFQGRAFSDWDDERTPHAAVVNRAFSDAYFPGASPLGRRIFFVGMDSQSDIPITIVGVAGNVRSASLALPPVPEVAVSFLQRPERASDMAMVIRGASDPAALAAAVRRETRAVDPGVPVESVLLERVLAHSLEDRRDTMLLVALFGGAALALAVVGIYGLVSYTVSRRAAEMGIRIALGAQAGDILRMVLRQAGFLAGAGVLAGSVAAFLLARLMEGVLFGISPAAPLVYLAVAGLVAASAIAASYGPARRASRVDPVAALRG